MTARVGHGLTLGNLLRAFLALWLAVCPVLLATPSSPAAIPVLPAAPVEENDNEEEQSAEVRSAVEWVAPTRGDRRFTEPAALHFAVVPVPVRPVFSSRLLTHAAPSDPFRNGLGTPYRC